MTNINKINSDKIIKTNNNLHKVNKAFNKSVQNK